MSLLIKNGLVYIDSSWQEVNILIDGERFVYVGKEDKPADEVMDATGLKIISGIIDPHVHFALYCGTVTSVDDFESGSRSAAYGGVTTIIDFLDPTRNARKLERSFYDRLELAKKCHVDYHFHACIKEPDGDLEVLQHFEYRYNNQEDEIDAAIDKTPLLDDGTDVSGTIGSTGAAMNAWLRGKLSNLERLFICASFSAMLL